MGSVRFTDIQPRPTEVLDVTRLTVAEFQPVVAPCEAAFRRIWRTGALMGNRAPPSGIRPKSNPMTLVHPRLQAWQNPP
jgi:hypothetical protein